MVSYFKTGDNFDIFETQQQKEVVGEHHAPGNLPPWKFEPIVQEAEWASINTE